jgi:sulfocyanin
VPPPLHVLALASLCLAPASALPVDADEIAPAWMKVDAATEIVRLQIVGSADGTNGTMNFNGYGQGEMSVIVPLGWTVHVDFENKGLGALPHSLVIINPVTPLPIEDGVPAFPRALTVRLVPGLLAGETDSFEFAANKEGRFLFFCGVTGHGVAGMWDYLIVSKEAKLPRVEVTRKGGAQATESLFAYDGRAWRGLSEGEKLALLSGFLIGEALEQGLAVSGEAPMSPPAFLEALRRERRLRFPFAPTVYKARLEDFYHYQDRLEVPLYRALFMINEHILQGGR